MSHRIFSCSVLQCPSVIHDILYLTILKWDSSFSKEPGPAFRSTSFLRRRFANFWSTAVFKIEVFECPSNTIRPFKIYLFQNNPSKRNPKLKMNTSLKVLNIIFMSQKPPRSEGHCHYKKWSSMVDSWFFTLYWKHVSYNSCTSFICISFL